jgi:DnaJ like chaperone protein
MNDRKKDSFRALLATNAWWGKILGAFFGYLTAGPAGAFFGILIGNIFDRGLASFITRPHWYYHQEKQKEVQKVFFYTTFAALGHIAKADGRVTQEEIHMATVLMDEMRLSKVQRKYAKQYFTEGKQANFDLSAAISNLVKVCHHNRNLLKLFADIQYRAAKVDGLTQKKIKSLDVIFSHLGFAPLHKQYRFYQDYEFNTADSTTGKQNSSSSGKSYSSSSTSYSKPSSPLDWAYALLELPHSATKSEIKRAYRKLMSQNHPDKLIAQGLPEEMIKMATDKTQKIQKAYEQIKKHRGFS